METQNKREFQQITFNHLSGLDFQDYESLQKIYCKAIFFKSF